MNEFKVGDVVRLKSGGPAMTVTARHPLTPDGEVSVAWCEKAGEVWGGVRDANVSPNSLVLVPTPDAEASR